MTRVNRLLRLSRADFERLSPFIKEQGRFFVLMVAASPDGKPRFACIISKKTARRAVERNLIRRRCRAAVNEVSLRVPYAFVFTAKRAAVGATYEAYLDDVRTLIVKVSPGLKGAPELQ